MAWFPEKVHGTRSYDWALVDLSSLNCPPANQIEALYATAHPQITQISKTRPRGNVFIVTRRGLLFGLAANSDSVTLERFGIKIPCGYSVQLLDGHFGKSYLMNTLHLIANTKPEPGDSGSWVVDATTVELCGTLVAGLARLGSGYVISTTAICSDIADKANHGMIDLPRMKSSTPNYFSSLVLLYSSAFKQLNSPALTAQSSDRSSVSSHTSSLSSISVFSMNDQTPNGKRSEETSPTRQPFKSNRTDKRPSRQHSNSAVGPAPRSGAQSGASVSGSYKKWVCGHCRGGPMIISHHHHCIFCFRPRDAYSIYDK